MIAPASNAPIYLYARPTCARASTAWQASSVAGSVANRTTAATSSSSSATFAAALPQWLMNVELAMTLRLRYGNDPLFEERPQTTGACACFLTGTKKDGSCVANSHVPSRFGGGTSVSAQPNHGAELRVGRGGS